MMRAVVRAACRNAAAVSILVTACGAAGTTDSDVSGTFEQDSYVRGGTRGRAPIKSDVGGAARDAGTSSFTDDADASVEEESAEGLIDAGADASLAAEG